MKQNLRSKSCFYFCYHNLRNMFLQITEYIANKRSWNHVLFKRMNNYKVINESLYEWSSLISWVQCSANNWLKISVFKFNYILYVVNCFKDSSYEINLHAMGVIIALLKISSLGSNGTTDWPDRADLYSN